MALLPFSSRIIADTGISMGDEGKGRLVHEVIAEITRAEGRPDAVAMVLKVNGGANAGHTTSGLKFNLLPCGVPEPGVRHLALGAGVVADPRKIHWEMRPLEASGRFSILPRLLLDERTMVSDLTHRLLDLAAEHYRVHTLRQDPRGSTGRGISPAYTEETAQTQIHYQVFRGSPEDFSAAFLPRAQRALALIEHVYRVDPATWFSFFDRLTEAETRANREAIEHGFFPASEFDFHRFLDPSAPYRLHLEPLVEAYWRAGSALAPAVADLRETLLHLLHRGDYVIAEFGQSYWLDKRHGFAPNVTASHTWSPEFFLSAGIPLQPLHTIGVCKAYDTKVGTHVFLTRLPLEHPLGARLSRLEFGTSTGRQRMVGWFDAVEKGDALRFGGGQDLMINKIDVLGHGPDWQGDLLLCTAYRDDAGREYLSVPRDDALRRRLQPVYKSLPGWQGDLSQARHWLDLPPPARHYVAWMLRSIVDVATRRGSSPLPLPNIRYLGVGPDPKQIISDLPAPAELLALAR